jgi:hypothetical protein
MAVIQPPALPGAGVPETARRHVLVETGMWVTLLLALGYMALFATVSIVRYLNFHYGGDTADYAQMLWNTAHGHWLQKTNIYTSGNGLRGGHAEPLLLLLAIPYALIPDPRTMLVLQTLALASGGPLTFLLARVHGHNQRTAVGLGAFYLVFPLVHYANIWDFHPDPFAVPALFGALLAFDLRRWPLLTICVLVMLLAKEQMVLFVVGLGAYWWLARGERRIGLAVIGCAALYALLVLVPWYLATASQFNRDYGSYFSDVQGATGNASGPAGIGGRLHALLGLLGQPFRTQNLVLALLPSSLLFLFDWSAIVVILPLAGLFVSNEFTNDFWFHHYVTCVPLIMYGSSRVLLRGPFRKRGAFITILLIAWASLLGDVYAYSSLNMMHWIHDPSVFLVRDDHARAQAAFIRYVPDGVPLDADSPMAAHLANRTTLYQTQNATQPSLVPYTLLDLHLDMRNPPPWLVEDNRKTLAYIQQHSGYRVARSDPRHGLYLFANCGSFPASIGCHAR